MGLIVAGKGVLVGGGGNGTVRTGGNGSVLTRRRPLRVSAGFCEDGVGDKDCDVGAAGGRERPAVPGIAAP